MSPVEIVSDLLSLCSSTNSRAKYAVIVGAPEFALLD